LRYGGHHLTMLLHVCRGLLVLLPVHFAWGAAPVLALDFNALFQHRATGGENIATRHFFQQRYSLGAGTGLSFQPTHAISAGLNLGYTRTQSDLGLGMVTREQLTPSAFVGVTNDIFRASLTGTATESWSSSGSDLTSHSWDAALASNWQRAWWPDLWLTYGQGAERRGAAGGMDTRDSRYAVGAEWDLLLARSFYAYSHNRSEHADQSRSESDSHFARVETGGRLWQNRLNIRLSQQFQHSTSEASEVLPGDGFLRKLEGGVPLAAVVEPVAAPDPEFVELGPAPLLGDDDREGLTGALEIGLEQQAHLGISFDSFSQQLDRFHIYLEPFTPLTQDQVNALQWDLYVRSLIDETTWTLAAPNIPAVYNVTASRFELPIDLLEREVKVVVTNLTGAILRITELEAFSLIEGGVVSRQNSYLTNGSMSFRLTPTLVATSSMTLERTEAQAGETETDSLRRALSGSLRWTPVPYIAPSVRFSEARQEQSDKPDASSRSYALIVATYPLPTLNITVGATRTDRFSDARKIATNDNYSLTSTARLYPDLTAGFSASYSTSSTQEADVTVTRDAFSSRLNFNARLTPTLHADLTNSYQQSETAAGSTSSSDSRLGLAYRPSDLLSMRLGGTKRWSGTDTPATLAYNLNVVLLRTHNTRVTGVYNHLRGGARTVNFFGLDGSWDISRSLALQTRFNYESAAVGTWSILTSLALRL
jgi:hypothetical protein